MDDLRTRIALRKKARRKRMVIKLAVLAAIIAVIAIVCVSCNNSKSEPQSNNENIVTDASPTPILPESEIPAE